MLNKPHIVAFGGGVDSTAMILGLYEQNRPIDLIMFADTGGERPETYAHIDNFSKWLVSKGLPSITVVKRTRRDGSLETLEEECHRRKNLPSIAYGFKSCSQKHKIAPQDKYLNSWQPAINYWKTGDKCVKYIGYDAGEQHRADNAAKLKEASGAGTVTRSDSMRMPQCPSL
jgi:3'-phosphoadenosine 5'-phosphosulfate sulfotransferase (PAPS reductase)/FAD synthetase